jgi:hypothetical protein
LRPLAHRKTLRPLRSGALGPEKQNVNRDSAIRPLSSNAPCSPQ